MNYHSRRWRREIKEAHLIDDYGEITVVILQETEAIDEDEGTNEGGMMRE